ncbi:MAG: hypothetical protein WBA57_25900 [Elainellaceae cyanobacterium]
MIFQSFYGRVSAPAQRFTGSQAKIGAIAIAMSCLALTACSPEQPDSQATQSSETAAVTSTDEGAVTSDVSPESVAAKQALANYFNDIDATMYGAYWCPHCADQKAMFGEAVSTINYVECDPEGDNAQPQLCIDEGIEGFPTWKINGELYPGVHSLEQLADISGYDGPQDFE